MTYRDDKDAAIARADALERQLETETKRADELADEVESLRERAGDAEKQRDRLQKRLARYEGGARKNNATPALIIAGVIVAIGLGGGVVLMMSSKPSASSSVETGASIQTAEPIVIADSPDRTGTQSSQQLTLRRVLVVRDAIDRVDHAIRGLVRKYPGPEPDVDRYLLPFELESWVSLRDIDSTIAVLRDDSGQPNLDDMDDAARRYADHLEDLLPTLEKALRYWEHEDYKDDDFALARQLDEPLRAGFARFVELSDALRAAIPLQEALAAVPSPSRSMTAIQSAWLACGAVVDAEASQDRDALLASTDRCDKRSLELRELSRSRQDTDLSYLSKLFRDAAKLGKKLVRESDDRHRTMAYGALAQVISYSTDRFLQIRVGK